MENNIPTAQEFWNNACKNEDFKSPSDIMIEFTKLHIKSLLEEIADDYLYYLEGDEGSERLDKKKFFKEVYPLTNIV